MAPARVAARDPAGASRASAPAPPAAAPANAARVALEHLCRALRVLGVGGGAPAPRGAGTTPAWLTAETLRRAKFDHPESAAPLLRAVHDLLLVAIAGFPDARVAAETLDAIDAGDRTTPGDRSKRRAAFVTAHLRAMGYPRVATLLRGAEGGGGGAIREDEEGEGEDEGESKASDERSPRSRPLLFALAWLVRECDVFARAHADEHAPALEEEEEEGFTAGTLRPPYPPDSASAPGARAAAGERAASEERAFLAAAAAKRRGTTMTSGGGGDSRESGGGNKASSSLAARAAAKLEPVRKTDGEEERSSSLPLLEAQARVLASRLHHHLARVSSLERARAVRRHRLERDQRSWAVKTRGDPRSNPSAAFEGSATAILTAYEVLLARDRGAREAHARALEKRLEAREGGRRAIEGAGTFWLWVESALDLEEEWEENERKTKEGGEGEEGEEGGERGEGGEGTKKASAASSSSSSSSSSSLLRVLESSTRRVGATLRARRRDVEHAAKRWGEALAAAEADETRKAALMRRAARRAAELPAFEGFFSSERGGGDANANARGERKGDRSDGGGGEPEDDSAADDRSARVTTPPPLAFRRAVLSDTESPASGRSGGLRALASALTWRALEEKKPAAAEAADADAFIPAETRDALDARGFRRRADRRTDDLERTSNGLRRGASRGGAGAFAPPATVAAYPSRASDAEAEAERLRAVAAEARETNARAREAARAALEAEVSAAFAPREGEEEGGVGPAVCRGWGPKGGEGGGGEEER